MPLNLTIWKINNFFLIFYGEISVLIGPIPRLFVTGAFKSFHGNVATLSHASRRHLLPRHLFSLSGSRHFRCLGQMSQRLQWPLLWSRVVRRPSVCRPLDNLHFQLLLQNRLMDLMKLGMDEVLKVPYKCCCFLARSAQGRIQVGAKIGFGGSPSSKYFCFRPERYSNKPNAYQWSRSIWKEVLLFLVSSGSQIFDAFFTSFWTLSFWYILIQFL